MAQRVARQPLEVWAMPSIELPFTRPVYCCVPAVKVIWSPITLPFEMVMLLLPMRSEPVTL